MLSDKQLTDISFEIDETLGDIMNKYQVSPLSFTSIVLARIMRLAHEVHCDGDFKKIMSSAIQMKTETTRVLQ